MNKFLWTLRHILIKVKIFNEKSYLFNWVGPWPDVGVSEYKYHVEIVELESVFLFNIWLFDFVEEVLDWILVSYIELVFGVDQLLLLVETVDYVVSGLFELASGDRKATYN